MCILYDLHSQNMTTDRRDHESHLKTYRCRRSLRLRGFDYSEERAIHLTWGTYQRRPLLRHEQLARQIIDLLTAEASATGIAVPAFCLMPDHVHVLTRSTKRVDIIAYVQRLKSRTTRAYWDCGGRGKLWQRGFYDRILRKNEDIEHVADYILANPVRAGLVDDISAYPFSGTLPAPRPP